MRQSAANLPSAGHMNSQLSQHDRSMRKADSMYSLFANIPDGPAIGGNAIREDNRSQTSLSGISR